MIILIALLSGLIGGLHGRGCRVIMIPMTGPRTGGNPIFQTGCGPALTIASRDL